MIYAAIVVALIFGAIMFLAGMGYAVSRSICEDDYDWDDFDEDVDTNTLIE